MSTMLAFDTLAFAKKLRGSGYTDAQAEALAEAQAEVFRQMLESTLATKDDIQELQRATKADIQELRMATQADIRELDQKIERLDQKIDVMVRDAVKDMKIWFGGMLVLAIGVVAALVKLL